MPKTLVSLARLKERLLVMNGLQPFGGVRIGAMTPEILQPAQGNSSDNYNPTVLVYIYGTSVGWV